MELMHTGIQISLGSFCIPSLLLFCLIWLHHHQNLLLAFCLCRYLLLCLPSLLKVKKRDGLAWEIGGKSYCQWICVLPNCEVLCCKISCICICHPQFMGWIFLDPLRHILGSIARLTNILLLLMPVMYHVAWICWCRSICLWIVKKLLPLVLSTFKGGKKLLPLLLPQKSTIICFFPHLSCFLEITNSRMMYDFYWQELIVLSLWFHSWEWPKFLN